MILSPTVLSPSELLKFLFVNLYQIYGWTCLCKARSSWDLNIFINKVEAFVCVTESLSASLKFQSCITIQTILVNWFIFIIQSFAAQPGIAFRKITLRIYCNSHINLYNWLYWFVFFSSPALSTHHPTFEYNLKFPFRNPKYLSQLCFDSHLIQCLQISWFEFN